MRKSSMRILVALGMVGSLGVVGCASNTGRADVRSSKPAAGIRQSEPLSVAQATIDADGVAWILAGRDDRLTLEVIQPSKEAEPSVDLGPVKRFGSIRTALVPDDSHGVVVATVHCASSDDDPEVCDDAVLDTTAYVLERDKITSGPWAAPAPVADPSAVSIAGRGPGSLALRSGAVIVSKSATISAGPSSSLVCLDTGVFTGAEDLTGDGPTPSTFPADGAPVQASLSRYVDNKWVAIEGSDVTYSWSLEHTLDFRCGMHGIELAEEGQAASKVWDGSSWQANTAESTTWMTYDAPPAMTITPKPDRYGLVGIDDQGNVVRVDSKTGAVLATVSAPTTIDRWWESTAKGVRVGTLALGSTDPIVAISCPSGGAEPIRCDVWNTSQ